MAAAATKAQSAIQQHSSEEQYWENQIVVDAHMHTTNSEIKKATMDPGASSSTANGRVGPQAS